MNLRRVTVQISGRVQGVGFRMWTHKTAKSLNLKGWVRNLEDGSVEALIEGDHTTVDQMITKLHEGPKVSRVDEVVVVEEPMRDPLEEFSII